eukprot:350172-Chlamydomonas_euryale.AAC.1
MEAVGAMLELELLHACMRRSASAGDPASSWPRPVFPRRELRAPQTFSRAAYAGIGDASWYHCRVPTCGPHPKQSL